MAIQLQHATFSYPNGFMANEDLTLTIEKGENVAIVGQNGAGKTTAVKLMNALHRPQTGDVLVDGVNTKDKTTAQIARHVGYVFQNPDDQIFNQTVIKEIEYMPRYFKLSEEEIKRRRQDAVELVEIRKYLKQNPFDIPYPIRKFVSIAAVVAANPEYIILDEPTAGQDKHGTEILEQLIKELQARGKAVITITHDMEFVARNFTRVVAMANKRIIADGTPRDIFWDQQILDQSRIKKPQIGQLANMLGLDGQILYGDELVARL